MSNRFSELSADDLKEINRLTIERLQSKQPAPAEPAPAPAVHNRFSEAIAQLRGVVTVPAGAVITTTPQQDHAGVIWPKSLRLVRFTRDELREALITASEKVK